MLRWRKQEELKAKMAFKSSIADYMNILLYLPTEIVNAHVRARNIDKLNELSESIKACYHAWLITEGLLESNVVIKKCWDDLSNQHKEYISGKISSSILGAHCMGILHEKFIFK